MGYSIKDVARHAGVSIATVSRVISNNGYPVSDEVRSRVLESAQRLHYVPNHSARTLRMQNGNGIALIVRDIGDPYFTQIAQGVTETAMNYDCLAMVFNSMQNTGFEKKYYQLIQQWQFSGVLIGGGGYQTDEHNAIRSLIRSLQSIGIKTVALAPQGMEMPLVSIDNYMAGKDITNVLIRHGHRKIAFIGGYPNHIADEERLAGYRAALDQAGIGFDSGLVYHKEFSWQGGYESCSKLINSGKAFTAICCSNDHIAAGTIQCLNDAGLRIPEDISVTGMGDLPHTSGNTAQLTTIHFPFYEMGRRAVEMLLGKTDSRKSVILECDIIMRDTVAFI